MPAKRKTFRLPNGYGSVVKLSGHRRRPYWARVTAGYDDKANPIYKTVGYYESREAGLDALAVYHRAPYNLDLAAMSFSELFEVFSKVVLPKLSPALQSAHRASYKHCSLLYKLRYRDIRAFQMQHCIDSCGLSYATESNIRNLFVALDAFAYDNDIISKCYSANLSVSEAAAKEKQPFSRAEIAALWAAGPLADEALFMLYTGMRVTEMCTLETANVDLAAGTIKGGIKSAAGKGRIIPLHPLILPIVQRRMGPQPYLFGYGGASRPSAAYSVRWDALMKAMAFPDKHTTHDCRHTFRSALDSAGANKVCIDLLMGHRSRDIGERVYTHKTLEELRTAIALLDYSLPPEPLPKASSEPTETPR